VPSSVLGRVGWRILGWIEPEANPSGVVYGTITVGALLAAEASRQETFPRLVGAVVLALVLYWMAHAYSVAAGERFERVTPWSARRIASILGHEAALLRGAAAPLVALLIAWAAGADLSTAAGAALWTAAAGLVLLGLVSGLHNRLPAASLLRETLIGAIFGGAVLALRVVLH